MKHTINATTYAGEDYFTLILKEQIKVICDCREIYCITMKTEKINGAIFIGNTQESGTLFFTRNGENIIYRVESTDNEIKRIVLSEYPVVRLIKHVRGSDSGLTFALDVGKYSYDKKVVVYDFEQQKEIYKAPYSDGFHDIAMIENENNVVMLVEERRDVSRYEDDLDYEHFEVVRADVSNINSKKMPKVNGYLSVFEQDCFEGTKTVCIERGGIRWPLFDWYFYYWQEDMSISSDGLCVIYLCKDIKGIILGSTLDGSVIRLFEFADGRGDDFYYFNDEKSILTHINKSKEKIVQYEIGEGNVTTYKKLNGIYDDAYKKEIRIRNEPERCIEFEKMLYKALFSTDVKEVRRFILT